MCATPTTSVGVILPLSRVQDDYNRKLLWRFLLGWEKGLAFFFCHTNKAICILEGVFAESQGLSRL